MVPVPPLRRLRRKLSAEAAVPQAPHVEAACAEAPQAPQVPEARAEEQFVAATLPAEAASLSEAPHVEASAGELLVLDAGTPRGGPVGEGSYW